MKRVGPAAAGMSDPLRLGYACAWWHPREHSWSYSAAGLLHALRQSEGVVVPLIDAQRPLLGKAVLAAGHKLFSDTGWKYGAANLWLTDRKIERAVARHRCQTVLAVGAVEPLLSVPTFRYQDVGVGFALAYADQQGGQDAAHMPWFSHSRLQALAARERGRHAACAGVFTMGQWYARWLIEQGGLPADKVHPVGGGMNAAPTRRRVPTGNAERRRLLFVGRDFCRKGGDLAVDAVGRLNAAGEGPYRLTVVGPASWPLEGEPPDWVDFRGSLAPAAVAALWAEHDVFVLPSWFEPYGLVFLEARAAGLPCVARRAFAMPELVPEGRAGALVPEQGGVEEVAESIRKVSHDDALFDMVAAEADQVAKESSWSAVAARILEVTRQWGDSAAGTTQSGRSE